MKGVVLAREGSTYRVDTARGRINAVLRGTLKHRDEDRVVAGDLVELDTAGGGGGGGGGGRDDIAAITAIRPRKSVLARRASGARGRAGGRSQPIAANVDQVIVVAAARQPELNGQMLDRFLVIAEANGLPSVIVLNKIELDRGAAERLAARFRPAGYPIVPISVKAAENLAAIRDLLTARASVLTGDSGVGKSSLINALQPGLNLRIGAVSVRGETEQGRGRGKGRHTTRTALLVPLLGGYVVDTPGLRDVAAWGIGPDSLAACFPEFRPFLDACRFDNCRHLAEPECAVREAAQAGRFDPDRLRSYERMYAEVNVPSWSSDRRHAH